MAVAKERAPIDQVVAARVLFGSDRTCCVCRKQGKPVQIHHMDENPSNNESSNLAVLCFDCHRETQISGGFDRKLDAEQVTLYRDDWHRLVAVRRAKIAAVSDAGDGEKVRDISLTTSMAEIYRDNEDWEGLAVFYDSLGNTQLRDKYVELALKRDPGDSTVIYLRGVQGRPDLIPDDVAARRLKQYEDRKAWSQRARANYSMGHAIDAAFDYVQSVHQSLSDKRYFSAAYYLKELVEKNLIDELFIAALREAKRKKDLWWQIRSLQELGWREELASLLLKHRNKIMASGDLILQQELALAEGNNEEWLRLQAGITANSIRVDDSIVIMSPRAKKATGTNRSGGKLRLDKRKTQAKAIRKTKR